MNHRRKILAAKRKGIAVPLAAFILCLSAQGQRAEVEETLRKLEKNYNTTEAVTCSFVQEKAIKQLAVPVKLTGKLIFKKPHFLLLELRGEENYTLYVNGEHIWLEDLDLKEVETYDFAALENSDRLSRLLPPVFFQSGEDLKSYFEIRLLMIVHDVVSLELLPKPPAKFAFQSVRLDVDEWGRITRMKTLYDIQESTELKFSGWKRLPGVSNHIFRYRGPAKSS